MMDLPLSTMRDINDHPELDSNLSLPGVSDYARQVCVLVKYVTRKTEYCYAAICSSFDEEDGELRVTFLKICNQEGTLFKLGEKDVSDVPAEQIIRKLPVPNLNYKREQSVLPI